MNQRYAEALTIKEAVNKTLGKRHEVSFIQIETQLDHDLSEQRFADHLLDHKGKIGNFDFLDAVSQGRTLFVGEGNMSFSLALAKLNPSAAKNFIATTFEPAQRLSLMARQNAQQLSRIGAKILNGVDATRLETHFGSTKFHTIIFNFPNVASRAPIYGRNPNHILARKFLRSAAKHLAADGLTIMTVVDNPHYDGAFRLPAAAQFAGFGKPKVYRFKQSRFPGYRHTNTLGEDSALAKHRNFNTWVFRLP